ncbi:hypothetical protein HY339_00650 [Candidatus Gottesmanbacteria bacterium]|nr:hypothetical protein [Candidatus Gottesmanbacteria bacterium]
MREKVFAVLIVVFLLASLAPTLYEIRQSDRLAPIRAFELVHNFPTDFNFYLSRIRQGIEGRVTVKEQYTSEPHKGSFIHIFYLFLGWLGRWVRVPWHRAGDVYHVARIVFGGLLLVMIAQFCKKSFSFSPIHPFTHSPITFLLAVTASTWPKLVNYNGGWRLGGYMPWWSVMDSLQRITFIPHLLVGQALIVFLIIALSDETTMKKPGNWIFLGVLAFMLGIIFPPGLLFVIATAGVLTILEFIYFRHSGRRAGISPLKNWIPAFAGMTGKVAVLILGIPSLIYLSLMTSFYPWKRLAEFDIIKPLPFNYTEYLLAVGPILPIGLIGLFIVLWKREKAFFPAVAWVLAWAMLLFIFQFIPSQSPLRFSEMIPHVPLGVLGSYAFYNIYNRYNHYKYYIFLLPAVLIAVGLGVMYSSYLWQKDFIDHKMRAAYPLVPTGSYVMYPLKDFIAAIRYIQDATGDRTTVILSETTAGNYMPVYSGNTVYVGHANTVRAEEKEVLVKEFFSGRMKPDDAKAWLERENLRWIFFGPQEKEDGGVGDLSKVYPFLTQAYKNAFVMVFKTL